MMAVLNRDVPAQSIAAILGMSSILLLCDSGHGSCHASVCPSGLVPSDVASLASPCLDCSVSLDMSSRFASANDLLARSLFGLRQACRHAVLCPIGLPLRACALLFWFGRRTQAGLASRVVPSPSSDGGVPITHGGVPQSDSHVDNCRTVPFDLS